MCATRKDQNSIIDITTKQDIITPRHTITDKGVAIRLKIASQTDRN